MATERTDNPAANQILDEYNEALQLTVARAIDGQITKRQLETALISLAKKYLGMVYTIGGGNLTSKNGIAWQKNEDKIHKRSARKLANDIFSGKYNATTD